MISIRKRAGMKRVYLSMIFLTLITGIFRKLTFSVSPIPTVPGNIPITVFIKIHLFSVLCTGCDFIDRHFIV